MKKAITVILLLSAMLTLASSLVGCSEERVGYRLTVEDTYELLYQKPSRRYKEGERVVIKTHMLTDVDLECFVNGNSIGKQTAVKTGDKYTHWEFYFIMPAENVTVTFKMSDVFLG